MKVLMPFWRLNVFYSGFVLPLTKGISKQLSMKSDSLHIIYVEGKPKQEFRKHFIFHKLIMPSHYIKSKIIRFYLSRTEISKQIKKVQPDVILTLSDLWAQELSRYYSGKMNIPYAVRLRGDHRAVRKSKNTNLIMRKILNYFQNRSLKKANIVIPNSQELIEKAVTWGIEKQKITPPVYNGVDTQMFKPLKVERNEKFTIAYAGRISPEKRVLRLLKVTEKMTDICFMIAGKKQMNISFPSSVEYLGELPFSEMPEFYNKADLIVLPSVTEGFPNVLLEAYACGKPVLVAKEAFPNELKIFGAIGILDEFELKIKTLIRSDLADLGRQARAYVMEHYSWERFGKLIVDQLENLVSLNND